MNLDQIVSILKANSLRSGMELKESEILEYKSSVLNDYGVVLDSTYLSFISKVNGVALGNGYFIYPAKEEDAGYLDYWTSALKHNEFYYPEYGYYVIVIDH